MGQLFKENRRNMNISKAFAKINEYLDKDYQKLSDKIKNLELSHNRMRKLLKMSLRFLEDLNLYYAYPASLEDSLFYLHKRLTLELKGLENYKGLKGG